MFRYKYLILARFENSYTGCWLDIKYSNMVGVEAPLGTTGPIEWSATAAIADGYPEFESDFGEYRAWGSVNAQIGLFKMHYGYNVIAFGLEWDI
jgi:hypothetical protein